MGQGQWARGREQEKVWEPGIVREKVEWAAHFLQAPEEIVYAQIVDIRFSTYQFNHVIKKHAPSAVYR